MLPALGLERNRRLESFRVAEALSLYGVSVFCFELVQGTDIKGVHGASLDADGLLTLLQSFQAEVALLHLGVFFSPELWSVIRAGFEAQLAIIFAQACLSIYCHDTVFLPFGDGIHRAGRNTGRFKAVVASYREKGDG